MRSFDLLIIGAGSGNSIIGPEHDSWDIAIAERALFGGTCLNVGCIPSKMFVYTSELAELSNHGKNFGLDTRFKRADWPAIRDRIFGRIDPLAASGLEYRHGLPNVTVFEHSARFVAPMQVAVGNEVITAERIVIAAGAGPSIPPIVGLEDCGYHTSDTIMRVDTLPNRLLVIGGGYIAAELGNVMGVLGSDVTFILRGETFLRREDTEISSRFTDAYNRKFNVLFHTRIIEACREGGEVVLHVSSNGETSEQLRGDVLLVATGRRPNTEPLNLTAAGIDTDKRGYIMTDDQCRTNVDNVWALGDIANPIQLKHVANHEARVVRHNLTLTDTDDPVTVDHRFIPHAVFGSPQVASVGLTESDCRRNGISYAGYVHPYSSTAYGWAMEDTTSVVKVIADSETQLLLGAHIIGPQASTLIQQLIQCMHFGLTVSEIAHEQYYIHPALPEVIEQALIGLEREL
ncbi:MAG: mycothione reductase [Acidimicrobiaceae bacterium]|nr:mycothione reductase [Acidimicrobiaceae bacterium]